MSTVYRNLIRPVLFMQDSEEVHQRTLRWLSLMSRHPTTLEFLEAFGGAPRLETELWGLKFANPLGLAAGMDKHASALPAWEALGFGFVELGGVTRYAQPGSPTPRMFRAVRDRALINRMGFNNPGADAFATTLEGWRQRHQWPKHPVGINLGKSKITPLEDAAADYLYSFQRLRKLADFFVVNVSSPNTPGLRELQDKAALEEILTVLQQAQSAQDPLPILVKVAPDLAWEALDEILAVVHTCGVSGIVATNTTIARPESKDARCVAAYQESGGLSGAPLRQRSTEVIRYLHQQTDGKLPIIGVGGIFNAADAWEKITAGASLIQIYSGLVYEGPSVIGPLVDGLRGRLQEAGFSHLHQAVGTAGDL